MIEIVDNVEVKRAGRPILERTNELYRSMVLAKSEGKAGLRVGLEKDERERFQRFTHRARSAAEMADVKISISRVNDDSAVIKIK